MSREDALKILKALEFVRSFPWWQERELMMKIAQMPEVDIVLDSISFLEGKLDAS